MKALLIHLALLIGALASDYSFLSTYNLSFYVAFTLILTSFLFIWLVIRVLKSYSLVTKETSFKLLLITGSLSIALILSEGLLRGFKVNETYLEKIGSNKYHSTSWPDKKNAYWHLFEPHDTMVFPRGEFIYSRITNSLGLSEREIDLSDTTKKKILCLGDSFTEGIGTSADSSWPRQMEVFLHSQLQDTDLIVYNAGVAGADPIYNYHLLRHKLWDINWNAVVFCINPSDIHDVAARGGMERFRENGKISFKKAPWWEPFYACSYLVRAGVMNLLHYNWTLHSREEDELNNLQASQTIAKTMLTACSELKERGVKMLVVVHPTQYDIVRKQYAQDEKLIEMMRLDSTLAPLDLLPYLTDSIGINDKNYTNYYWPKDGHFKAVGYHIMAEKIGRQLQDEMKKEAL